MFLIKLILCYAIVVTVDACKWLDEIPEQVVDFRVEKEGFHRRYIVNTKISSLNRFMDCKMAIKVIVPKGAYIDIVNLDAQLLEHCFNSPYIFDVEQPEFANSTKEQPVYFHVQKSIRKLFVIQDTLAFDIHLRYHAASDTETHRIVEFKPPEIYLSCQNNDTVIFTDKTCERFSRKIPCSCGQLKTRCSYIKLNAQPSKIKAILEAKVPVANKKWIVPVLAVTAIIIAGALALLLRNINDAIPPSLFPGRRMKDE